MRHVQGNPPLIGSPVQRGSRWKRGLAYASYLVAVLGIANGLLHGRYVGRLAGQVRLQDVEAPAGLDARTAARLGRLAAPRTGSFAHFLREKPPGTIRIGCFGDSFTYGSDVVGGSEYAGQLRALLSAQGLSHVEVLNFGNPGFGFHQTLMMFEQVGRSYDLDYAVFLALPAFWRGRDVTFTFWPSPPPPSATSLGFHARYILKGDGLELVEPLGDTESARFFQYNALIPALRYLRYDTRPPALLRAWLPPGRTLANPFYYRSDPRAEADETYRRLLPRLAPPGGPMPLVLDAQGEVPRLVSEALAERLNLTRIVVPDRFPYMAPARHYSPWGQRLVAEHALRVLGLLRDQPVPLISVEPVGPAASATGAPALEAGARVSVTLEGRPRGSVYQLRPGSYRAAEKLDRFPPGVRHVVAVPLTDGRLVDGVLLGLGDRPLEQTVTLREGATRIALPVRLESTGGPFWRLDLCAPEVLAQIPGLAAQPPPSCTIPVPWWPRGSGRRLEVMLGDLSLLTVMVGPGGLRLHPTRPYYRVAPDPAGAGSAAEFPATGRLELSLRGPAGEPLGSLPIGRWLRQDIAPLPVMRSGRPLTAPVRVE